jgi:hypothetical protein
MLISAACILVPGLTLPTKPQAASSQASVCLNKNLNLQFAWQARSRL